MSEVVVRATPGPALWRVTRGTSELVILGVVSPTPVNGAWNSRPFAQALQGARVLMLSPGSTPGFAWADYFPASERFRLNQPIGHTLAREMGDPAVGRFDRMATDIRQSPARYSTYRPAPAGMILLEDSWAARGLSGSQVDDTAIGLAKAAHVRVMKVDEGGALPLIDAMPSMSDAQQTACVGEAMDEFTWESSNVGPAFQAWATRDLGALRNLYKPLSLCMESIPGGAARRKRADAVWLKALSQALATPGRAVVVMDVADLLPPSALLAAFRAEGATVVEPQGDVDRLPGLTLAAATDRLDVGPAIQVADAPLGLQVASSASPSIAYRTNAEGDRGKVVDLAGAQVSCVVEVATGTMIPKKICHTSSEWTEIQKLRAEEVRLFYDKRNQNRQHQDRPEATD